MNSSPSLAKLLFGSLLLCSGLGTGCVVTATPDDRTYNPPYYNSTGALRVDWYIDDRQLSCEVLGDPPIAPGAPDLRGARIYIQVDDAASKPYYQDCRALTATSIANLTPGSHRFRAFVGTVDERAITTTTDWIHFSVYAGSERREQVSFYSALHYRNTVCYDRPATEPGRVQTPGGGNCTGFSRP